MVSMIFVVFYVAILCVLGLLIKWEYVRLRAKRRQNLG